MCKYSQQNSCNSLLVVKIMCQLLYVYDSIFSCVYKHVIKLVGCGENLMCTGGNINRPVIYIITVDESMWRPICLADFHDKCTHGQ